MPTAIALGTFDGLHAGHRAVLDAVLPYDSAAVTFAAPPKMIMSGEYALLMTPDDKYAALKEYGIKTVEVLDFDAVRDLDRKDFLDQICRKFDPAMIACGYNYRFGKNALGDAAYLQEYGRQNGIRIFCAEQINDGKEAISSTRIRTRLTQGETGKANRQIYGGFGFSAPVLHGDSRGRTLEFPTVNQQFPKELVCPKKGVYVSSVQIGDRRYTGITNLGHRPTYPTREIFAETHILDFSGDLYDRTLTLKLLHYLRPERKFNSAEELTEAIKADLAAARNGVTQHSL